MQRVTLFAVAEGQSELAFLRELLAAHLAVRGIDLHVPVIGKGNAKGGLKFRTFAQVCDELRGFLSDRRRPWVTTFFDYYGLPTGARSGWQWVPETKAKGGVVAVESRLRLGVQESAGHLAERFLPYIQMHELEALYFAEPETLAAVLERPHLAADFTRIVADAGGCERINDSPTTAPSKRLQALCPHYVKGKSSAAHAPRLGKRLSLATVHDRCPRFGAWLTTLEQLTDPS
jgi:hypothetical protein